MVKEAHNHKSYIINPNISLDYEIVNNHSDIYRPIRSGTILIYD